MIISRSLLLRMRNISDKAVEKIETHISCNNFFFFRNRAVYEIMWENTVEPGRLQMTKCGMHIACWTSEATNTHSGYVIFIAFPLPKWLHVCALTLRYMHIACLVYINTVRFVCVITIYWTRGGIRSLQKIVYTCDRPSLVQTFSVCLGRNGVVGA
jgi:hypothetical protein